MGSCVQLPIYKLNVGGGGQNGVVEPVDSANAVSIDNWSMANLSQVGRMKRGDGLHSLLCVYSAPWPFPLA
jgi:hypothetical protein